MNPLQVTRHAYCPPKRSAYNKKGNAYLTITIKEVIMKTKRILAAIVPALILLFTCACGSATPVPTAAPTEAAAEPTADTLPTSPPPTEAGPTVEVLPTRTLAPVIPEEMQLLYSISAGELAVRIPITIPRGIGLLGMESGTNLMPGNYMEEMRSFPGTPFSWAPDGTRLAFISTRSGEPQLYTMYADGSNVAQLTDDGENDSPAWSPDGSRIAFVSRQGGEANIHLINPDGGDLSCLTCDIPGSEVSPVWSPDGLFLAFTAESGPAPVTILTLQTMQTHPASSPELKSSDPVFSPDGEWIAFVCEERICINSTAGQVLTNIVSDGVNIQPSISPDGKQIAFISNRDGNYELYVVNTNLTDLKRLTNTPYNEIHPDWSPDGQWIAFSSATVFQEGYTNYDLFIIRPNGDDLNRLTSIPTNEYYPLWSPQR